MGGSWATCGRSSTAHLAHTILVRHTAAGPLGRTRIHGCSDSQQRPLRVSDIGLDALDQLRGDLADAMLLGMLTSLLEHRVLSLPSNNMLTPAGWIDLGALEYLRHGLPRPLVWAVIIDLPTPDVCVNSRYHYTPKEAMLVGHLA